MIDMREVPLMDTSRTTEALDKVQRQIEDIRAKIAKRLQVSFDKENMHVCTEVPTGGFFNRRDNAAIEAVVTGMRDAFFAGFKRSDQPPPSEARIEAAFREWMERS
jgi:hypothetical protein